MKTDIAGNESMTKALRLKLRPYLAGEIALARVFVRDMLIVGSLVNILIGGIALIAYAEGAPGWLALAIFLAPFPYNLTLCIFVWRSAGKSASLWNDIARAGA